MELVRSIADLHLRIHMFGKKLDDYVGHPLIRPSVDCIAMTYGPARQPEYEDLMLATSHLTDAATTPQRAAHPRRLVHPRR